VLQLWFLAYQDQTVTWGQRVAVWIDVALVIALWPLIMDRDDSWRNYLSEVGKRMHHRWRIGLAWATVWAGFVLPGFVTTNEVYFTALWAILVLLILLVVSRGLAELWRRWRGRRREPRATIPTDVRGMPGLLLVVALGVPLPLGLLTDGEWWEEELLGANTVASEVVYDRLRFLDLNEQVILAKPAKPGLIAQLGEGDPQKMEEALKQVERVKLRERSLRHASFAWALLPRADLRGAHLQGADLFEAHLRGADLSEAYLQGADLSGANLQGADLFGAKLQGADLFGAKLQGANLFGAELQGVRLQYAHLQGAYLSGAQLESADLTGASLQGADLQSAELYGANIQNSRTALLDLRAARWRIERAGKPSASTDPRVLPDRSGREVGAEL
jgi:uncharacterized protein YjbI with pentapeptide repeats